MIPGPPIHPPAIVRHADVAHAEPVHWTCKQLRRLWVANGGPRNQQDEAAAVSFAESSGYRWAQHINGPGNVDKGLWQINNIYWPGLSTYNVKQNVRAAILIHGRDGWTAWSSVKAGAENGECGYP